MKLLLLATLFAVQARSAILFTDPVQNALPYNWLALGYGVPHAVISELGYFYHPDCFTGMLTFANGVIGMQVFSDISFTKGIDWAKYLLALAQLASDAFIALVFCDYQVRLSSSA